MKTFRRFAFLFLALAFLTQTVPVSADSRSFSNTHWYVSGLSCGRPCLLDEETRSVLPLIGTCRMGQLREHIRFLEPRG